MKHPALTRVMSTVLAIMCVIMLLSGLAGIGDAKAQLTADERAYTKLTERIATFEELTAKLDGIEPSKTAKEKLDAKQEQHDKDASEYRMDLAERGATQGGYKLGADKLWEAKAQLKEGEFQYQAGRTQFEQKAAEFEELKEQTERAIALAQPLIETCAAIGAKPQMPPAPVEVQDPGPFVPPEEASEEEIAAAEAEHAAKVAEYNKYLEEKNEYDTVDYPKYEGELAEYNQKSALILAAGNAALVQAGMGGGIDDCAVMAATLSGFITETQKKLAAGEAALNEARVKLDEAGGKIEGGKQTIQANLEQIWYEMGQADEAESEFAERRSALMAEAEELAKETEELEQRKQDENKLSSMRVLLRNYDGVRSRLENGGSLPESAKEYAAEYSETYHREYKLRLAICVLAIVGGAAGLACIPAAYEKRRSRALLLIPAVLALACAVAAEAISVAAGLGQVYSVVPTIIFALLYLLCAAPKKRKVEGTTLMA